MSTPTENESPLSSGDKITYEQINALANNMYERLLIMDEGDFRKLDPTKDTKSVYIEKSKLDALFAANPGSDGLKIYFGVHDSTVFKPRQPNYNNKLTASFVTTTKEVDNLDKLDSPQTHAPKLVGALGGAKLCPPNSGC